MGSEVPIEGVMDQGPAVAPGEPLAMFLAGVSPWVAARPREALQPPLSILGRRDAQELPHGLPWVVGAEITDGVENQRQRRPFVITLAMQTHAVNEDAALAL